MLHCVRMSNHCHDEDVQEQVASMFYSGVSWLALVMLHLRCSICDAAALRSSFHPAKSAMMSTERTT